MKANGLSPALATGPPFGTVVIGGSQSGLAAGYYLKQRNLSFVILDEHERIGDAWRNRWDSLRLFTPARYDRLPGMPLPGAPSSYPTKDETADYLEAYAREFDLPVRTGVRVDRLSKAGDRFEVRCGEHSLFAENVIVATGAFNTPRVPAFARGLDDRIVQLHSKQYRTHRKFRKDRCSSWAPGTRERRSRSSSLPITRHGYPVRTRGRNPPAPEVISIA